MNIMKHIKALISAIILLSLSYCTKDRTVTLGSTNQVMLSTSNIQGLTADSCFSGGMIQSDGGDSITERGVCWATIDTPLITIHDKTIDGSGRGSYKSLVRPLKPNTTYYARAYVKNAQGIIYGNILSFRTPSRIPTVTTDAVSSISHISATVGGNISSDGGAAIMQRGIYWSEINNSPGRNDSIVVIGSGTGSFSTVLARLKGNRTYHIRAWATNSVGIASAPNVVSFTTLPPKLPILGPTSVNAITWTTADASSSIVSNEGSDITQYGFCWSRTPNPTVTVGDRKTINSNVAGNFSLPVTSLSPGTLYYIRAFALNEAGYGYSPANFTFSTPAQTIPKVSLTQAAEMGATAGYAAGIVTEDGGAPITARGFLVSTNNPPPLNSRSFVPLTVGLGAFNADLSPLAAGVTYYVRAYAINQVGMALSPEVLSFHTRPPILPSVITSPFISGLSATSVVLGGNVTSDGNGVVTERGICYATTTLPTISNSRVVMGSGTGTFSGTLTGLIPDRLYFYQAYAINASGAAYGGQSSFLTPLATPVLISPSTGALFGCCSRVFSWSVVNGADRYEIQFSRNNLFTNPINIDNCSSSSRLTAGYTNWAYASTNSFCLNTGTNLNNGLWYWRVRALSQTNASEWSSPNYFTYSW